MDHDQLSALDNANQVDRRIEDAAPHTVGINLKEFSAKFNDKKEIYNFLSCEVGVLLPHHDYVTIYFLRELMTGKKLMLRNTEIRHIHIPQ